MNFTQSEVKSGVLAVVCFALLTFLTFKVSDFRLTSDTRLLTVYFDYIGGLEANAPVHYAGHSVGTVKSVEVRDDLGRIEVVLQVSKKTPVRSDSKVFVDTLGLLGEKFVALTPGTPSAPLLPPGEILQGIDPLALHQVMRQMDQLTKQLIPITEKTGRLLEGGEEDIATILDNLNAASANLKEMTSDLKLHPWKLLRKGKEKKGKEKKKGFPSP